MHHKKTASLEYYQLSKDALGEGAYAKAYVATTDDVDNAVEGQEKIVIKQSKPSTADQHGKNTPYAVCNDENKILKKISVKLEKFKKKYDDEERKYLKNGSSHLVQYYGSYKVKNDPMITYKCTRLAFEFMDQGTLHSFIHNTKFDWKVAYPFVNHVATGLSVLHAMKIIHCDIKPDNIFITTSEDGVLQAKIGDFGLAQQTAFLKHLTVQGTPIYMAPELFRGESPSYASDMYSLGVVLFEMIHARSLFARMDDAKILPALLAGERENIKQGAPEKISLLTRWCWLNEKNNRPTANQCRLDTQSNISDVSEELSESKNLYRYDDKKQMFIFKQ